VRLLPQGLPPAGPANTLLTTAAESGTNSGPHESPRQRIAGSGGLYWTRPYLRILLIAEAPDVRPHRSGWRPYGTQVHHPGQTSGDCAARSEESTCEYRPAPARFAAAAGRGSTKQRRRFGSFTIGVGRERCQSIGR
jgi:hypothetical protein